MICWAQDAWYVRDLHSRNGTFLGAFRLSPESGQRLEPGSPLRFGEHPLGWELESDSPPLARAEGPDGACVVAEDGLLLLPDERSPRALIFVDPPRGWVAADEEHVQAFAEWPLKTFDLGSRAQNYTLLTLARARARDAALGELPQGEQGWLYQEELCRMLRLDRGQVNLHIFRARKQLQNLEVQDAKGLVERRLDTHQLRIGVGHLLLD